MTEMTSDAKRLQTENERLRAALQLIADATTDKQWTRVFAQETLEEKKAYEYQEHQERTLIAEYHKSALVAEVTHLRRRVSVLEQALSQRGDSIELQEAEQRGFDRGQREIDRLNGLIRELGSERDKLRLELYSEPESVIDAQCAEIGRLKHKIERLEKVEKK